MSIKPMTIGDDDKVYAPWLSCKGMEMNPDDLRAAIWFT